MLLLLTLSVRPIKACNLVIFLSLSPPPPLLGGSPTVSISSNMCFSNPISASSISPQTSNLLAAAHGARMPSLPAVRHRGCYGNIPCSQPSAYNVTPSGVNQSPQQRNPNQIIASQNNAAVSRQAAPGQGNNIAVFEGGQGMNSQQGKLNLNPGTSAQRPSNVLAASNSAAQNWASPDTGGKQQEARKAVGSPFPTASPYPNQPLQRTVAHQQFPQRAMVPNQLAAVQMRTPVSQMNQTLNGQVAGTPKALSTRPNQVRVQAVSHLNPPGVSMTPPNSLPSNHFQTSTNQTSARAYHGTDHTNDLAFDFLNQQNDTIGPALNSDSDFIDSLLKTEPGNDDWMKDINLDEILGGHS